MKQDGAHILLFNKDKTKIFLVRRNDYPLWGVTGGGIEKGETPKEAVLREANEETGFKVSLRNEIYEYNITNNKNEKRKDYLFIGKIISGEFVPEFQGCLGKWFNTNNLPLSMSKSCKIMINDAVKYKGTKVIKKDLEENNLMNNLHLLFFSLQSNYLITLNRYFTNQKSLR